jgi:hypothetical protein
LNWFLIIFVVALALAPLSHFAPSKRQRQVAKMREQAAVSGLFVEFRSPPGADNTEREAGAPRGGVIYYGRRLPARLADNIARAGWRVTRDGWRSVGARVAPPACLEGIGVDVIAASIDQDSCGVYWTESVDAEHAGDAVTEICRVLDTWLAELSR